MFHTKIAGLQQKLHTWKLLLGSWFAASWGGPSFGKFWTGLCRNGNHPTWCLQRKHIKSILVNIRVTCTQEFKGPLNEMRSPLLPSSHQSRTWLEARSQAHLQRHSTTPAPRLSHWPVRFLTGTMETRLYSLSCAQQHKQHLTHSMCSINTSSSDLNLTHENLNRGGRGNTHTAVTIIYVITY